MPKKVMSLRATIMIELTLVIAIMAGALGYISLQLIQQKPILEHAHIQSNKILNEAIPLLIGIEEINFHVVQVQQWLTDISATRGLDGLDDGFTEAESHAGDFRRALELTKKHASNLGLNSFVDALVKVDKSFPAYYETGKKMAHAYVAEGPAGGNKLMGEFDAVAAQIGENVNKLVALGTDPTNPISRMIQGLDKATTESKEFNDDAIYTTVVTGVVGLAIILLGAVHISMLISRNFDALRSDIDLVMSGNQDTPLSVNPDRTDEFGSVAKALAHLRGVLKEQIQAREKRIAQRELEANKRSEMDLTMVNFTQTIQTIVENVFVASDQLHQTAESMTKTVEETHNQVSSVNHSSSQMADNVETSAQAVDELDQSIAEIRQQATIASTASENAVEGVHKTAHHMKQLADTAVNIGQVSKLISDIAEQTNLLALNATIESARAGEAGKGFAVVASEVKALAMQTGNATEQITRQIDDIQQATRQAEQSMGEVGQVIDDLREASTGIASAIEEQSQMTSEIARNMNLVSNGSKTMSDTAAKVDQSTQVVDQASNQVMQASGGLNQQAEQLKREVKQFLAVLQAS